MLRCDTQTLNLEEVSNTKIDCADAYLVLLDLFDALCLVEAGLVPAHRMSSRVIELKLFLLTMQ